MAYTLENNWSVTEIKLDTNSVQDTFPHACSLRLRSGLEA